MIGAEVEHGEEDQSSGAAQDSRGSLAAPLRGYPADSSVRDIATARRLLAAGAYFWSAGGFGFLWALRKLSPPNKKISEFSTKRSAMAVAMVVL